MKLCNLISGGGNHEYSLRYRALPMIWMLNFEGQYGCESNN